MECTNCPHRIYDGNEPISALINDEQDKYKSLKETITSTKETFQLISMM